MNRFLVSIFLLVISVSSCSESIQPEKFDLKSLPKEFSHLTETDTGLVVYNSCDAGNLLISLKEDSQLLLHGQQEDYSFEIVSAHKLRNDTIQVATKWLESQESEVFHFHWLDKAKGLIKVITKNSNRFTLNFTFVDDQFLDNFKTYNQPCTECWPEEDCD